MKNNKTRGFLSIFGSGFNLILSNNSYTVLVLFAAYMMQRLGCAATDYALIFTLSGIGGMFASLFAGQLVNKLGARVCALSGAVFTVIMILSMVFAPSKYVIWVIAFFFGACAKFNGAMLHSMNVNSWYKTGRGTLNTIFVLITNAITILIAQVTHVMMASGDYVKAAVSIAGFFLVIFLVDDLFLIQKTPEKYGMEPVEFNFKFPWEKNKAAAERRSDMYELKMPAKGLFKVPVFWILIITPALITLAMQMYYPNMSLINASFGLDETTVANVISFGAAVSMIITPLYGIVSDATTPKTAFFIWCGVGVVGLILAPVWMKLGFVGACIIIFGNKTSNTSGYFSGIVWPPIIGREKAQLCIGWTNVALGLASTVASYISAALFEATGTWTLPLVAAGVFNLLGFLVALFLMGDRSKKFMMNADIKYMTAHPKAAEQSK